MTPNRLRNLSIGALVQNAAQNNGLDSSNLDENLAADFDGSFSGLGVDMNAGTSNYSMSDALMALPNISISTSQIFKHEAISPADLAALVSHTNKFGDLMTAFKDEHQPSPAASAVNESGSPRHHKIDRKTATTKNIEALDLSNDEAHFPEPPADPDEGDNPVSTSAGGATSRTDFSQTNKTPHKTTFTGSVSRESSNEGPKAGFFCVRFLKRRFMR